MTLSANFIRHLVGVAMGLALVLVSGCATAPVTGRHQLMLVSEQQAGQMGDQAYAEILSKSKVSHDPKYVDPVRRVGERIAKSANKPDYKWEFNVIDEPQTINAFALPGGKVAVYTGLLNLNLTDDELATVMAHEVGHVLAEHSRERMSQELSTQVGLAVLGASTGLSQGELDAVNLALGIGIGLPFSRKQESEADLVGLDLMSNAGYDPRAALAFWKKMSAGSGGAKIPALLSTHPSDADRMHAIEAALPKYIPVYEAHKQTA